MSITKQQFEALPVLNDTELVDGQILRLCKDCRKPITEEQQSEAHGSPEKYLYHTSCWDEITADVDLSKCFDCYDESLEYR